MVQEKLASMENEISRLDGAELEINIQKNSSLHEDIKRISGTRLKW